MTIRTADKADISILASLACGLWPNHEVDAMREDMAEILEKPDAVYFLAHAEEIPVGFAQCQLRHDYVEGTDSSPVGYLEGIYVAPEHRNRGIAGALLRACEKWAAEQGCREFASDCELDNTESLRFHRNLGFEEANRIICFTKKL
jgi:aminoglycoside 6'-N-acetyltransferase I